VHFCARRAPMQHPAAGTERGGQRRPTQKQMRMEIRDCGAIGAKFWPAHTRGRVGPAPLQRRDHECELTAVEQPENSGRAKQNSGHGEMTPNKEKGTAEQHGRASKRMRARRRGSASQTFAALGAVRGGRRTRARSRTRGRNRGAARRRARQAPWRLGACAARAARQCVRRNGAPGL
jgi:hypothetical protein